MLEYSQDNLGREFDLMAASVTVVGALILSILALLHPVTSAQAVEYGDPVASQVREEVGFSKLVDKGEANVNAIKFAPITLTGNGFARLTSLGRL